MSIDRRISSSAHKSSALAIGNMLVAAPIPILPTEPEIYKMQNVRSFVKTHQQILGLKVPIENISIVDCLDSLNHLVSQHEHRFQRKLLFADHEQVLESGAKEINYC